MATHASPNRARQLSAALILLGAAILILGIFIYAFLIRHAGRTSFATNAKAIDSASSVSDPLNDVLRLVRSGDVVGAMEKFLAQGEIDWIQTTSLQEFKINETEFVSLGTFFSRHKQAPLQQRFIDRVGEIKKLAQELRERAIAAESQGDKQKADEYIHAINRLGQQLNSSNTVLALQQTGMALERMTVP